MAATPSTATPAHKRPVTVFIEPENPHQQPATFSICPLGLQFYAPKPIPEFELLDLDLDVTDTGGRPSKVSCRGAVVRCQAEKKSGHYRIWVKFIDLPASAREAIRCTAKNGRHLCEYCENF